MIQSPNDGRSPIAVVGPTASGKSALAVEIALATGGEIINVDSVQVYREIQIATAKIPENERKGIPHHLIDFVSPETTYTAGDWSRDATRTIREIEGRGKVAVLAGGTGFYLRAFRAPLFTGEPTDPKYRDRLTQIRNNKGPERLHRMLKRLDPTAADRLFPRDWPRVQRSLEVRLQTKRPISEQLSNRNAAPKEADGLRIVVLNPPRDELYRIINLRTLEHFNAGLVDEVQRLLDRGVPANSNALGAHGYRRVVEYLKGERTLKSAIEQTQQDIRNYAKRQITWFKREPDTAWFEGFGTSPDVQQSILEYLNIK